MTAHSSGAGGGGAGGGQNGRGMSKTLLQMKFMQKTASKLRSEEDEEEMGALEEQWVVESLPAGYLDFAQFRASVPDHDPFLDPFQVEPSLTRLHDLAFGRVSFKGMNKELEALAKIAEAEANGESAEKKARKEDDDDDIDDEEMGRRYDTFVNTVANKFKTKRRRKEEDDDDDGDGDEKRRKSDDVKERAKTFLKPKEYES